MEKKVQEYISYLSPNFIFIPFDNMELLHIKKNKLVYNNMFLGETSTGKKLFSPVSGKIVGVKQMDYKGFTSNSLVIENDFIDKREKLNPTRNMNKTKKADIVASLEKYDLKDVVINHESYEEILEAIDEFLGIFNMKNCYICIDRDDLYSINAFEKYINAFLNICIVHSNKKFKDETCVFYTIEEILAIHKAIHLDYMYDNTIITINDGNPTIVKVKLFTPLFELFKALKIKYTGKDVLVDGEEIKDIKNFVIDSSVRSIIVKDKQV